MFKLVIKRNSTQWWTEIANVGLKVPNSIQLYDELVDSARLDSRLQDDTHNGSDSGLGEARKLIV